MRSLQLVGHTSSRIGSNNVQAPSFITNDPESKTIYIALEDEVGGVRIMASTPDQEDASFVQLALTEGPSGGIISFTYLSDLQAICLGTRNGDIILFHKERFDAGDDPLEIVGSVDTGLEAMTWSPDQDLVILITGEKNVLEMTQDFDTITEFPLHVGDQGQGVQHSVGWGKKETQFHGSEGKQAALRKVDTSKFGSSIDDDKHARVAWRGDGSFFVCSDIDPRKDARVLRIHNREGVLQNTSEPVDQLEHVLDWKPSGNLIVSSQRLPHRHDIVFVERNGLRHGEFTLRESGEHRLIEVSWNADSTVLAIWLETNNQKSVQLWTMNNYHWYMKQHIVLPQKEDIIGFSWDVELPLHAHIVSSDGIYHSFDFIWNVLTSTSTDHENSGYVAVIDGDNALMTPFNYQNVPPPMCSLKVNASQNIQQVTFHPCPNGSRMAAVTNEKLEFFDLPVNGHGNAKSSGSLVLPCLTDIASLPRHITLLNDNQLFYVTYDTIGQCDILCLIDYQQTDENSASSTTTPFEGKVGQVYYNATTKDLVIEGIDGSVWDVQFDDSLSMTPILELPSFCPWIATALVGSTKETVQRVIIGLTERSKLYANDRLLSSEATSFFLRHDWLVFTTTSHTARFLPLDIELDDFKLSDDVPDANDESHRRVERGSKIVLATQSKSNLILQMPRGNLETISPRAFVLASIREDLKSLNYRSAFITCRRNRIDLNILFDENPQQFFDNIQLFITQVPEVDYLNLFLSNLRNEDVTKTMYQHRGALATTHSLDSTSLGNKVNNICDAVRTVLTEADRDQYIQSILSTYVRSSPPDLESALSLLAEIRESNLTKAEEALKYTIFLCKADSLYDIALGMYNFSLVLMVAQQAQMDPREYLPFLQELQNLDKYYQRFKIDDHLKRHDKALRNLVLAGDDRFDELIAYMQKHTLYLTALEEYANKPQQKKVVLDAYGDYLDQTEAYEEAGIVFTMANSLQKALHSYRLAGSWREAFSLAKQMSFSIDDIQALAYQIIGYLKEKRRFQEAATVANDYIKDIEEAVDCLLKGSLWQEASRLSYTYDRSDLIETHVKPALIEGYTQLDEDLEELTAQFNKQTERLKELREKKPEPTQVLPNDDTLDNIDMFSDTTSMFSQFTRYTQASSRVSTVSSRSSRKSSRQRKRDERKRAKGKKGTIYEEEYLVNSLKKLYERANQLQTDIGNLIRAMVPFGYVEEATTSQIKFEAFLKHLQDAIDVIFVPLQLANVQFGSIEEYEEAQKISSTQIEKPVLSTVKWKLQIL
ncbi:IKI3 family-domain-containing protein [Halteromyces radiatus]|uniref:IKI3 family-domain-containing protein n=1 Tax=Halteromyces radiatus TaxID=101107 RepID=UPI002220FC7A|nr:IKI3 family-domain-containing protein [Halteromyces radiatus]KAI8099669.1 IKI3 family-domain-containing protein [Halteromyces radiatus]